MEKAGLIILVVAVMVVVAKGESSIECKTEKNELVKLCRNVVLLGQNPSEQCCEQVRVSHTECVCPYVTNTVANLLDVPGAIRHIESCGRTVPRNFKCGSITTPP